MDTFSSIVKSILSSRDEGDRLRLIKKYLQEHPGEDSMHFLRILLGIKHPPVVSIKKLMLWCIEYKAIPEWMLRKCHATVGDWIETICLAVENPYGSGLHVDSATGLMEAISHCRAASNEGELKSLVFNSWDSKSSDELVLMYKILTATNKPFISKPAISKLLFDLYGTDPILVLHRINALSSMEMSYDQLITRTWSEEELKSKPYPFTLPEVIQPERVHFGQPDEWIVEQYYHGTRVQIYKSNAGIKILSIDHELLPMPKGAYLQAFFLLPNESVVEALIVQDEKESKYVLLDIHRWLDQDRSRLGTLIDRKMVIRDWLVLHQITALELIDHHPYHKDSDYLHTIRQGWIIKNIRDDQTWYRIKPAANQLFTALMYVEYINQNSAIQYNLTLGVYDQEHLLIPITKVSSDMLTDTDKNELYYWIQNNTVQRFGPVRLVRSGKVISILYDRTEKNKRVKSGINLIHVLIQEIKSQSIEVMIISSVRDIKL